MKSKILKLAFSTMMLNIIVLPISNFLSILFGYLCFIFSLILPFDLMRHVEKINKKQFLLILMLILIVICNSVTILFKEQNVALENPIKMLSVFCTFLLAISVEKTSYFLKDLCFYFRLTRIVSVFLIIYTIFPWDFRYTIIDKYGNLQFTMSMGNPNATAVKVLFCVTIILIEFCILKDDNKKKVNLLIILGLMYTLSKLQSRTSFICALILLFIVLLLRLRIRRWMVSVVWIVPIVFVFIQRLLTKIHLLSLFNKPIESGREVLYFNYIDDVFESPVSFVLGNFMNNQLANNHNVFFTILLNFGMIGCIIYFLFWKNETCNLNIFSTKIANYAWCALSVFIIHSMAESAMMSGCLTFGICIVLINRMTKDDLILTAEDKDYEINFKHSL